MDIQTIFIIAVTVVVHAIGIGLFLVWLVLGKPMSAAEAKAKWRRTRILPWR